jgi:hypothetical protein
MDGADRSEATRGKSLLPLIVCSLRVMNRPCEAAAPSVVTITGSKVKVSGLGSGGLVASRS